jgi:hypothetical protein
MVICLADGREANVTVEPVIIPVGGYRGVIDRTAPGVALSLEQGDDQGRRAARQQGAGNRGANPSVAWPAGSRQIAGSQPEPRAQQPATERCKCGSRQTADRRGSQRRERPDQHRHEKEGHDRLHP